MKFNNTDIDRVFSSKKVKYNIPVYQRAYAWDELNWSTFLEDLFESLKGDNNYFYGNVMLEELSNGELDIIDGQQRLTTVIIFVRALINVLLSRDFDDEELFDIDEAKSSYLVYKSSIKLRPVEYDRVAWDAIIIENDTDYKPRSSSQKRYRDAKNYFEKRMSEIKSEDLIRLFEKLEKSEVNEIILEGKKESSLMFELQNNRGKDLTNMEKIKSFFMYKVYSNTNADQTENIISRLSQTFEEIYRIAADINLDEDSVLIYHNNAYLNGYAYRTIEDIKKELLKSDSPVNWIQEYSRKLLKSFSSIKFFESDNFDEKNQLKKFKTIPAWSWAFILKGYEFYENDLQSKKKYLSLLEKLIFRSELASRKAKIQEKLSKVLLDFSGDFDIFQTEISNALHKNAWYWNKDQMKHTLRADMYRNRMLHYILWEYEKSIQNKGYKINDIGLENEQIEHISPQTEPKYAIESGYQVNEMGMYDEEFEEKYINNIGNLMLISGSHNASIGNKTFVDKLNSYKDNPLLNQQAQLKEFVEDQENPKWGQEQIEDREKAIIDFAMSRWAIEN